ncbi:MAG TPA: M43 family zinc metalloprotease [Cytophagaceae bacterium]|jgi:hypothetical protein
MNIKILILAFFLLPQLLFSQDERCATSHYENLLNTHYPQLLTAKRKLQDKIRQKQFSTKREESEGTYKIPVVIHIIYYNEETNLSDALVQTQLQVLNEDFRKLNADTINAFPDYRQRAADVNIEFCLATFDPCGNYTTGVNRIFYNATTLWNGYDNAAVDIRMKALSYWPSDQYLNIWVADLGHYENGNLKNTLGYASFPSNANINGIGGDQYEAPRDGVAIDFKAFGRKPRDYKYDLGRTATHEIGHWLGLIHIWGDSNCGNDFVDDTPRQSFDNRNMSTSCSPHFSSCNENGPSTRDMHENFMDYTPDRCMSLFTYGQKERMHAVLETSPRRVALRNSNGCRPAPSVVAYPLKEDFEGANLPSKGWLITNRWQIAPPGGRDESFQSIKLNKDNTNQSTSDTIRLPYVAQSEGAQISLFFNYAYAKSLNQSNSDSIVVLINPGCDDEIVLAKLYGNELVTSNRVMDNFVPTSNEWKSFMLDLSPLKELPFFRISIINYSIGSSPFYLDDLNIYNSPLSLELKVFPNPAEGNFNMYASFKNKKNVTWELYDMLGHKVKTGIELETISFVQDVDTVDLMAGVYIVVVTADDAIAKQKVVVVKQ